MRWRKSENGVALVEFALVLPFLAIILFGIVDMGRAYRFENRLRNAAREGAQLAQSNPEKLDSSCSADPFNITYKVLHEESGIASLNPTITVLRPATATGSWRAWTTSTRLAGLTRSGGRGRLRYQAVTTTLRACQVPAGVRTTTPSPAGSSSRHGAPKWRSRPP